MQIKEARIFNFGKLQNKNYRFAPGLNVIYGENEAGKSTLHAFLKGMLFGIEKKRGRSAGGTEYTAYAPWHAPSYYSGGMRFCAGTQSFYLERNFFHKEKQEYLRNELDGEELNVEFGDLSMLLGGVGKEAFENTYDIPQSGAADQQGLMEVLSESLSDANAGGEARIHVGKSLQALAGMKRELLGQEKQLGTQKQELRQKLLLEQDLLKKDQEEMKETYQVTKERLRLLQTKEQEQMKWERQRKAYEQQERAKKKRQYVWQAIGTAAAGLIALILTILFYINTKPSWWVAVLIGSGIVVVTALLLIFLWRRNLRQSRKEQSFETRSLGDSSDSQKAPQLLSNLRDAILEKESRVDEISDQLRDMEQKSREEIELEENIRALELAEQEITRIAKSFRQDMEDEINSQVSKYVSLITNGTYDSIFVDEEGKLKVLTDGREVPGEALSQGTLEQLHLALRLALGGIISKEEPLPVFLDEAFAMYDDVRTMQTLKVLAALPLQVFVFTCHRREQELLKHSGIPFHFISME